MSESKKYKFSTESYFNVDLKLLRRGEEVTFPLFLYFKKSDHLVLRIREGQKAPNALLDKYISGGLESFLCPIEYKTKWEEYLKNSSSGVAIANEDLDEILSSQIGTIDEEIASDNARSDESAAAIDVLTTDALGEEERKEVLSDISSKMLGVLASLSSNDPKEKQEALVKCKEFTEDIVNVAIKGHEMSNIFDEIAAIKSVAEMEHSTTTSTFAVMFALGMGYTDKQQLADLSFGALLHDVGTVEIDMSLIMLSDHELDAEQRAEMEQHVKKGIELLEANKVPLTPIVKELILQHHEQFDGKGYPEKIQGFQIGEMSQLISVADYLDDLMSGRVDGKQISPAEALEKLKIMHESASVGNQKFNPDVLTAIVQMIEDGKSQSKDKMLKEGNDFSQAQRLAEQTKQIQSIAA